MAVLLKIKLRSDAFLKFLFKLRLKRETNLMQACSANQHQVIMPSWLPKVPSWLRKNALCLSQSAFSNFALHVITMCNLHCCYTFCTGLTSIFFMYIITIGTGSHEYLRNRKHVPCFYRVIQTRVEVWENEKCCGNASRRRVFPQLFRVLPNFHSCLSNSIETRSTCFLFLLENNATRKRKTTC